MISICFSEYVLGGLSIKLAMKLISQLVSFLPKESICSTNTFGSKLLMFHVLSAISSSFSNLVIAQFLPQNLKAILGIQNQHFGQHSRPHSSHLSISSSFLLASHWRQWRISGVYTGIPNFSASSMWAGLTMLASDLRSDPNEETSKYSH